MYVYCVDILPSHVIVTKYMVKVESILPRVRSHPIKPSHDSHNNKDTKDLNNFCEMLEVCARSIYFNTFSIFQPRSAANT